MIDQTVFKNMEDLDITDSGISMFSMFSTDIILKAYTLFKEAKKKKHIEYPLSYMLSICRKESIGNNDSKIMPKKGTMYESSPLRKSSKDHQHKVIIHHERKPHMNMIKQYGRFDLNIDHECIQWLKAYERGDYSANEKILGFKLIVYPPLHELLTKLSSEQKNDLRKTYTCLEKIVPGNSDVQLPILSAIKK